MASRAKSIRSCAEVEVGLRIRSVEMFGEPREVHLHGLRWGLTLNPLGNAVEGLKNS